MSAPINDKRSKAKEIMTATSNQFTKCPVITTTELISIMNSEKKSDTSMILVDVRSKEERDVSMIPDAISAELFEELFKADPDSYLPRLVVPYCTIGYRSGKYGTNLISQHGFTNVRNGEGIVLWTYEGTYVVTKKNDIEEPTKVVHTFGANWNLAADDYTTVQFSRFSFAFKGLSALFKSS